MMAIPSRASHLTLLAVLLCLILGGATLGLGVAKGITVFWGFGAACLLQILPALSLWSRIREGLGNSGLERERLTLRTVSFLLRILALGMAMVAASTLLESGSTQTSPANLGLAVLALAVFLVIWFAKQGLMGVHPALDLDATRTRALVELAVLLLAGCVLGRWFPWADAALALAMALRLFVEGSTLAKATTLQVACGGCGSGCGCG